MRDFQNPLIVGGGRAKEIRNIVHMAKGEQPRESSLTEVFHKDLIPLRLESTRTAAVWKLHLAAPAH